VLGRGRPRLRGDFTLGWRAPGGRVNSPSRPANTAENRCKAVIRVALAKRHVGCSCPRAMSNPDRPSTFGEFVSSFGAGVQSTATSVVNAFRPSSYPPAVRQAQQFGQAVTNPRRTYRALSDATQAESEGLDVPRTAARTVGDWTGAAAAVVGLTMAGAIAMRRPYLASGFGRRLSAAYDSSGVAQHPFFAHPTVRRWFLTRPLSAAVGAGVGTAAFVGSAPERAATAEQNRADHPRASSILESQNLHELAATPLSRTAHTPRHT
jgi:hypothetical protein